MGRETMDDESFTMKALLKLLGVSRSTLRYYEQLGIARPERDEQSNYRAYSIGDIYRIVECLMFRSAGYAVGDGCSLVDGTESSEELVAKLMQENERRLAWHDAMRISLARIQGLCRDCACSSGPRLALVGPWRAYYDNGETGYGNFDPDDVRAALLRGMPVSSFGSVFLGDYLANDCLPYRSFRTVPEQFAHLFPELDKPGIEYETFGDRPCVVVAARLSYEAVPLGTSACFHRHEVFRFMRERGYEPDYPAFAVGCYPISGSILSSICIPVVPKSMRARRALRKLDASHGGHL